MLEPQESNDDARSIYSKIYGVVGAESQYSSTANRVKASPPAAVHTATAKWLPMLGHWNGGLRCRMEAVQGLFDTLDPASRLGVD